MSAEARLKELGIVLPELRKPVANYLPYRIAGNILYLAGQGPLENGKQLTGKLGRDVSVEEGYTPARRSAMSCCRTRSRSRSRASSRSRRKPDPLSCKQKAASRVWFQTRGGGRIILHGVINKRRCQ